jgi:hypothetical protein
MSVGILVNGHSHVTYVVKPLRNEATSEHIALYMKTRNLSRANLMIVASNLPSLAI